MDLSIQKRMAAEILGVGISRIRVNPEYADDVSTAITREEIKRFIKEGIIYVIPSGRNSRGRWKERHEKRKKGRRRGPGKRKGGIQARMPRKEIWMNRIRKIRGFLRYLRDTGKIDRRTYRRLYMMAKGGAFTSLTDLKRYMKDHNLLPEGVNM